MIDWEANPNRLDRIVRMNARVPVHTQITVVDTSARPVHWAVHYQGPFNPPTFEGRSTSLGRAMMEVEYILKEHGTRPRK